MLEGVRQRSLHDVSDPLGVGGVRDGLLQEVEHRLQEGRPLRQTRRAVLGG